MAQHPDHQAANQRLDNVLPQKGRRSASTEAHRAEAPGSVRCYILTVSDTRVDATDKGGPLIRELLEASGHAVLGYRIVRDDRDHITEAVNSALTGLSSPEVLITTGGTGISPRDNTPEALKPLLTHEIPGFGEIFRQLSWEEVGPASMLSRAFAGVIGRTLVFALPGSTNAIRLGMEKIIIPELGHLVREVRPERRES